MSQRNDSFLSPNIPQDAWPKIGNLVVSSRPIFERGRAAEINTLCAYLPVPSTCLNYARFLCPWISPGKNTGVGSLFLLQGVFLTQDRTKVSPLAGGFFTIWATREAQDYVQMWRLQWVEFEDGPKLPAASCA